MLSIGFRRLDENSSLAIRPTFVNHQAAFALSNLRYVEVFGEFKVEMLGCHRHAADAKEGAREVLANALWGNKARRLSYSGKVLSDDLSVLNFNQGSETLFKDLGVSLLLHEGLKLLLRPKVGLLQDFRKLGLVPNAVRASAVIHAIILVLLLGLILQHLFH